jgi:hypothetical protein
MPSVGSRRDSYDSALVETINGRSDNGGAYIAADSGNMGKDQSIARSSELCAIRVRTAETANRLDL